MEFLQETQERFSLPTNRVVESVGLQSLSWIGMTSKFVDCLPYYSTLLPTHNCRLQSLRKCLAQQKCFTEAALTDGCSRIETDPLSHASACLAQPGIQTFPVVKTNSYANRKMLFGRFHLKSGREKRQLHTQESTCCKLTITLPRYSLT